MLGNLLSSPENSFLSSKITSVFHTLLNRTHDRLLSLLRLQLFGVDPPITWDAACVLVLFLATILVAWFDLCSENDLIAMNKLKTAFGNWGFSRRVETSPATLTLDPIVCDDAKYAEELQVEEALMASLVAAQMATGASSSGQGRLFPEAKPAKPGSELENPSERLCEICFEEKESWQMFRNDSCSHSFCYDCTSKHITARIQDNTGVIGCPAVNCNASLDFDACRLLVPKETLVRWDESLCQSLIPESQKLYCPYRDCSAMLINDAGEVIKEINCPLCKRSFCALCRVPWHPEFSCEEFQSLNSKKGGKDDVMVKSLAKKKHWQKCPRCKIYVEKSEGCLHMTCRCKYEFCYRCGAKWNGYGGHGVCRQRS